MTGSMNTKNDVEVVINGKQYTLCGYESNEYLQQIANHINERYREFKKQEGYSRLDTDMKHILLAINLSDEYYKAQDQAKQLQQQNEDMEKEIFDMKHELINRQTHVEELEAELTALKNELEEEKHKCIRLETELESCTKNTVEAAAVQENSSTEKNISRRSRKKTSGQVTNVEK